MHNRIDKHFAELEMLLIIAAAIISVFKIEIQAEAKPILKITYKPERDVKDGSLEQYLDALGRRFARKSASLASTPIATSVG